MKKQKKLYDLLSHEKSKLKHSLDSWKEISDTKLVQHLEVFNDAIIAIISTIMVLEIPLPEGNVGYLEFLNSVVIFLISFFIVVYFWYKNHKTASIINKVDKIYLILNFIFIAMLSLIPVLTKWMMVDSRSFAIAHMGIVYLIITIINIIMTGIAYSQLTNDNHYIYRRLFKIRVLFILLLNILLIIVAFIVPKYTMLIYILMPILSLFLPLEI